MFLENMDDILLIFIALAMMMHRDPSLQDKCCLEPGLNVTSSLILLYDRRGWGGRHVLGAWGRGLGRGTRRGS